MASSAPSPSGAASTVASRGPPDSDIITLMKVVTSAPDKQAGGYPPYAPYSITPAAPSVADTIHAGYDIRIHHKSIRRRPAKPPLKPARPRGPKATDVKMSKRALRAHALCLKRHGGTILTDRLEKISKPQRRTVIQLWREHADTLPSYTIARLGNMLDAVEPFKPDQAYEYFINLRKTKKKIDRARGVNQIKKDLLAVCADKRFVWARNATVSFARGIQQRLAKPGNYALSDSMLRLSNIVLSEICCYMNTRPPSRRCTHPKAKFLMEMADKIAVWIDDVLTESDDRMLMMDFDEDEEVLGSGEDGLAGFAEDFLNMIGGENGPGDGGAGAGRGHRATKSDGDMHDAAHHLANVGHQKDRNKALEGYNGAQVSGYDVDGVATGAARADTEGAGTGATEAGGTGTDTRAGGTGATSPGAGLSGAATATGAARPGADAFGATSARGAASPGTGATEAATTPGAARPGADAFEATSVRGAASSGADASEVAGTTAAEADAKGAGSPGEKQAGPIAAKGAQNVAGGAVTGEAEAGVAGTKEAEAGKARIDEAGTKAEGARADGAEAKAIRTGADRTGANEVESGGSGTEAGVTGSGLSGATGPAAGPETGAAGATATTGAARPEADASGATSAREAASSGADASKVAGTTVAEANAKGAGSPGAKEAGAIAAKGADDVAGRSVTGEADAGGAGTKEAEAGKARIDVAGTKAEGARADEAGAKATRAGANRTAAKLAEAGGFGGEAAGAQGAGASDAGADGSGAAKGTRGTRVNIAGAGEKVGVGVGLGARDTQAFGEQLSSEDTGESGGSGRRQTITINAGAAVLTKLIANGPDHAQAKAILHQQLKTHGAEPFYKQPRTSLTHSQALDWIKEPSTADKSTREAAETGRLANKFEKKLHILVARHTPENLREPMLDVIIEDSQKLSERFVSNNYNVLARENLISEMQNKRNEILTEVDGAAETHFFAAQRLKKTQDLTVKEPCNKVSYQIEKSLDKIIKSRTMPRKLTGAMKEHVKATSNYLSEHVTKPDEQIEAYVALLNEMETAGDNPLIEGEIPKSYKESAGYLAQLTSHEDQINRPNAALQATIENKLTTLMANVPTSGYSPAVMSKVIKDSTRLLVSYITLQGERTEALNVLTGEMAKEGDNMLLRHGPVRKSYNDGANMLRGKNTDQLSVDNVEPVVARKIQIKLKNLMSNRTPDKFKLIMDDIIEDATSFLAVNLLRPQVIKVCKCMKNVFVQCELWCDEILRRVARPSCTCPRHVSADALAGLTPSERVTITTGDRRGYAPGIQINVQPCPSTTKKFREPSPNRTYQAMKPTPGCPQMTSYLLYSQLFDKFFQDSQSSFPSSPPARVGDDPSPLLSFSKSPDWSPPLSTPSTNSENVSTPRRNDQNDEFQATFYRPPTTTRQNSPDRSNDKPTREVSAPVYIANFENWDLEDQTQLQQHVSNDSSADKISFNLDQPHSTSTSRAWRGLCDPTLSMLRTPAYNARAPIITTHEMLDWHAMMVSLMWNVQAWREWIQENINKALLYKNDPQTSGESKKWLTFQREVRTEAMQWRQYYNYSKRLSMCLPVRYANKKIMCPNRTATITNTYTECQRETLKITEIFNRWTQWLIAVVKESDSLKLRSEHGGQLNEMQWSHYKLKVLEHAEDWDKYNMQLKISWEFKYKSVILEWLPPNQQRGPMWVASACGAVPSGAVAAGEYEGEITWVARTTHKSSVWPAALIPSKHCCLVYANSGVHQYTKYQVMCNASVSWVAWRAGDVGARAVRVAEGVYVGRVQYRGSHLLGAVRSPRYRCHVVIFGRQFAFSCYELLDLAESANE